MPGALNDLTYAQSCPRAAKRKRRKCKFHYTGAELWASNYSHTTAYFISSFGRQGRLTRVPPTQQKLFYPAHHKKVFQRTLYKLQHWSSCMTHIRKFFLHPLLRSIYGQTFQQGTSVHGFPTRCNANRQAAAGCASLSRAQGLEWSRFEWVGQWRSQIQKSKRRMYESRWGTSSKTCGTKVKLVTFHSSLHVF